MSKTKTGIGTTIKNAIIIAEVLFQLSGKKLLIIDSHININRKKDMKPIAPPTNKVCLE